MRITVALVLALLVPAAPARADTAVDTLHALNQMHADTTDTLRALNQVHADTTDTLRALNQVRADTAADTLRALNQVRASAGVAPLRADARLARAARGHSRDMVARGYFAHVSPRGDDLRSRVVRTGWTRRRPEWRLGETLAWGTGTFATPQAVVDAWLRSPPHRRIVLARDLRRVGIGVAYGTPGHDAGLTYTADFGT
jgi:uncharacterized protein YkwD